MFCVRCFPEGCFFDLAALLSVLQNYPTGQEQAVLAAPARWARSGQHEHQPVRIRVQGAGVFLKLAYAAGLLKELCHPRVCNIDCENAMRASDVIALLGNCTNGLEKSRREADAGTFDNIRLKNILENFRSALDYIAHDIQDRLKIIDPYSKTPEVFYFPYGRRENHFKKSVKKNFPTLDQHLPQLFKVLQDVQPFRSGDSWLVDLCELNNKGKHEQLQKPTPTKYARVNVPGILDIESKTIVVQDGHIGDTEVANLIVLDGQVVLNTTKGPPISVSFFDKFILPGKEMDALDFISRVEKSIGKLVQQIYLNL